MDPIVETVKKKVNLLLAFKTGNQWKIFSSWARATTSQSPCYRTLSLRNASRYLPSFKIFLKNHVLLFKLTLCRVSIPIIFPFVNFTTPILLQTVIAGAWQSSCWILASSPPSQPKTKLGVETITQISTWKLCSSCSLIFKILTSLLQAWFWRLGELGVQVERNCLGGKSLCSQVCLFYSTIWYFWYSYWLGPRLANSFITSTLYFSKSCWQNILSFPPGWTFHWAACPPSSCKSLSQLLSIFCYNYHQVFVRIIIKFLLQLLLSFCDNRIRGKAVLVNYYSRCALDVLLCSYFGISSLCGLVFDSIRSILRHVLFSFVNIYYVHNFQGWLFADSGRSGSFICSSFVWNTSTTQRPCQIGGSQNVQMFPLSF